MTDHRDRVRALITRTTLKDAAKTLRMAELTLAKYVAGLPVAEKTELFVEARLRELAGADSQPAR